MSIHIIDDEPIYLTREEYELAFNEYLKTQAFTVMHVSFETWYRGQKKKLLNENV